MTVHCSVCGRELTDPESRERGIGPICLSHINSLPDTPKYNEDDDRGESTRVKPDKIIIGDRFRENLGDLRPLIDSIAKLGLLHPIVVTDDNLLVAGYRRLEAWKLLYGNEPIPVNRIPSNPHDIDLAQIEENTVRKDFTASEMVAIKRHLEPKLKEQAKERQGTRTDLEEHRGNFPQSEKTRDIIGKVVGVSGRTLEKAEKVVEAAERDPENFGEVLENVDKGTTSISYAASQIKRREKHSKPPQLPEGRFDVIYADPPWKYDLPLRGNPGGHYPILGDRELAEFEIPAADNSILFMWATNPKLPQALKLMEAWGFEYKTNLAWVKDRIGTGYYFRARHELLLLGKKGDIPPPMESCRPPSALMAPRREHSEKPDEIYEVIEKMYPNREYLELFARQKHEEWTSWGDEV